MRIPDAKMHKPHNECTNMEEKASPCEKNKLKVGVSWSQVVDDRVPVIPTIAPGVQVSSTACVSEKTEHPTLK